MKMQNFTKTLFFSFATVALLSAVSCSSDDDVVSENSKIEINNFEVAVAEGDSVLSFYAASNWSATLSTTSWIEIDEMTKVGSKGNSKVILKWKASTSIKERIADLTIAVDGETPVVIRITQLPNAPFVKIDKEESILNIDKKAANGRGQFRDTLTIQSNIKWAVKEQSNWIEYEVLGNIEPQEGVPTSIQMVLKGKPAAFDAAEMEGVLVVGKASETNLDNTVAVKAFSTLSVESAVDGTPLTQIVLNRAVEAGNQFIGRMVVKANTSWRILNAPSWVHVSATDNATEYAASLITNKTVAFTVNDEDLDTESLKQQIIVIDEKTGLESEVELYFPGTGNDFFESKLEFTPDFKFDASDRTWNFNMLSAQDYTSLETAPFKFYFVHMIKGMWPSRNEADWAWVELNDMPARAALNTKSMTLMVSDRNMMFDELNDKFEERSAYMIVVPNSVSFDDLFIGDTDDLKEEYLSTASMIIQKGVTLPKPDTNMPEYLSFGVEGGTSDTYEVSNFDKVSTYVDNNVIDPNFWVKVEFDYDESSPSGIRLKTQPNKTGKERTCKLVFVNYVEANDSEEHVITVTVNQKAE